VTLESLSVTTNEFPIMYLSGDFDVFELILDAIISYLSLVIFVALLGAT